MMYSNYVNNDQDNNRNTNNDIVETAALIITSQYLDNTNRNYSCFNSPNSINNHNSIFIQPNQIEAYSTTESSGHDHLMILAAAAVNSSPSTNSYKTINNANEPTIMSNSDTPHFSIHDPPLIRLSPTSPNNIFRNGRHNGDFQGMTNESRNDYSHNHTNIDWLPQELFVKTESKPDELTHSSLKRHSFNNSLSDTEFPSLQTRERTRFMHDNYQNSSPNLRPRKELKRKRLYTPRNDFGSVVNTQIFTPTSVDDFTTNLTTNTFINLTESDDEIDIVDTRGGRLTPELPRRNIQWWPIKRHCPDLISDDDVDQIHNIDGALSPGILTPSMEILSPDFVTPAMEMLSPVYETRHVSNKYSPQSPPAYNSTSNNQESAINNQDHESNRHNESRDDRRYDHLRCQSSGTNTGRRSTLLQMGTDNPQMQSSNSSSYHLRHVLVPQYCNRRQLSTPTGSGSYHDFSPFSQHLTRDDIPCPYRSGLSQAALLSATSFCQRHHPSDHIMQTAMNDLDNSSMHSSHSPNTRSAVSNNPSDNRQLPTDAIYQPITTQATTNAFLRAYELEQRRLDLSQELPQDPRLRTDPFRVHPLYRISERSFSSSLLDSRYGSHYHRQLGVAGNVESVIQLALHLETSWRGISAEEFTRLPCHYYGDRPPPLLDQATDATEQQDKCMVCLDEFLNHDQLRTLCCGHQYHVFCVDKWLKMNRTCPMCRSDAVIGSSNYVFSNLLQ